MWNRIKLYIISLWLLFALVIIKEFDWTMWKDNAGWVNNIYDLLVSNVLSSLSAVLLVLGVAFLFNLRYKIKGSLDHPKKITKIKNLNYEHLTFLTTYIIPFICFDLDDKRNTIIFVFLLVIIGVIYVKTNLFYSNPTLAILGYQIYLVDTLIEKEMILITQGELNDGDSYSDMKMGDSVFYAKIKNKPRAHEHK